MAKAEQTLRVALATQGTRGDFQPILALACGLAQRGHAVKIFGNPDHCKTAREFDFDATSISLEIKDFLATTRGRKAMECGDLIALTSSEAFDDDIAVPDDDTDWGAIFYKSMDEFQPNFIVYTGLIGGMVSHWLGNNPTVPSFFASYQPHCIPTDDFGPIMFQRMEADPDQPFIFRWLLAAQFSAKACADRGLEMMKNGTEPSVWDTPQAVFDSSFKVEDQATPIICAYSREWWPAPADWPKSNVEITGNWKIPKQVQEERANKGGAFFDAGGQHELCVEFIKAGTTPVYVGWGSMLVYSKEHMATLAVGALKEAGQRGIVVGGWALLSAESLDGAENAAELKEFSVKNVLFLKAAPHEWLFPQCACAVHHGGIGTAQASLSSGCPTIVTPVFADQNDISRKIAADRCGAATVHLSKVTYQELGAAIKLCCTDPTIKANVKELAERMQKEDGVSTTVVLIEKFVLDDVKNGKWQARTKAKEAALKDVWERTKKVPAEQLFATWNMWLMDKFPSMKTYMQNTMAQQQIFGKLVREKKLWFVKAESGCLARQGEGLKTPEVGRYKEFAFLEEISQKGNRVQVKRLKGVGPDEGWVSPTVSGKDIIKKCENIVEVRFIQSESLTKQFRDLDINGTKLKGLV